MSESLLRRQAYLELLKRVLPPLPSWDEWQARGAELPPDFAAQTPLNNLWNPLEPPVTAGPSRIETATAWRERRSEIQTTLQQWMLGAFPPAPPAVRAENIVESVHEGVRHRTLTLRFGPHEKARLRVELWLPPGRGPFPVFMTQFTHRRWTTVAVRRGYIGCAYAASDGDDDTDSYLDAYPQHDFTRIPRRAWSASRAIDYLSLVPEADLGKIALTGHSRNGKQSLIAAAFDERIACVIPSSPGAGGTCAFRLCSELHGGESVEYLTRQFPEWFHRRLRFFTGREDLLPFDLHELVALVAPRACLIASSYNDPFESVYALQRTVLEAARVYRLLEAPEKLRIHWRWGGHETSALLIERYVDWCDTQFGRGAYSFPERALHPLLEAGLAQRAKPLAPSVSPKDLPARQARTRKRILELCGDAPPHAHAGSTVGRDEREHLTALLMRQEAGAKIEKRHLVWGEALHADLWLQEGAAEGGRLPAVLWLHSYVFHVGYTATYKRGPYVHQALAQAGVAACGHDMIGFGGRVLEAEAFYTRFPNWSLLGKMLRDAQDLLGALAQLDFIDPTRIWAVGYGLGAFVGLHLAALDERLAGLIAVAPPQPFRRDPAAGGCGGLTRWSRDLPLLPNLGAYIGQEENVPYDLPELLEAIAPRPVELIVPRIEREAREADIRAAAEAARSAFESTGQAQNLVLTMPETYSHVGPEMQAVLLDRLKERLAESNP
ncbi:MAG: hypothetical protein HS116_01320 [Planctomycetes bacterium]|nr:hypothetical protein [Planctomycetota bacterium]